MPFFLLWFVALIIPCNGLAKKHERLPITLSAEQKKDDIRWFFNLVKDYYPFTQAIENEKGLASFIMFEENYLNKTSTTLSNSEFIAIVAELLQLLEQGTGHADLLESVHLPPYCDTTRLCLENHISKASIKLNPYWAKLYNETNRCLCSDFKIIY